MNRETRKLLHDALDAAQEILEFAEGLEYQEFFADALTKKATYYDFAVLGEALSKLRKIAPEYTSELSATRLAIDMRNRLIHGYATVDPGVVWSTIEQDIPNLCDELRTLLDDDIQ